MFVPFSCIYSFDYPKGKTPKKTLLKKTVIHILNINHYKIYKSGQPHQNVNNLIINTCRFCINRDKWGGYKDEKFQQFTISPLKNA